MVFCWKCGEESEDDAQFCMHCGARISGHSKQAQTEDPSGQASQPAHPSQDVLTEMKRITGKMVEKTVEVTGKVARATKPAAKKGWEATKTAVKKTAEATKKAGRKLQDKE